MNCVLLTAICLEEDCFSCRLAAHCGHSNAPPEYGMKEEKSGGSSNKKLEMLICSAYGPLLYSSLKRPPAPPYRNHSTG